MTKTWKISQTRRALSSLSLMALLLVALLGLTAGCSAGPAARDPAVQPPAAGHEASLPEGFPEPPDWFEVVPEPIQHVYAAAAHHPEELQYIPCYCGCGEIHASNFHCYFQQDETGAVIAFDWHAAG